MVAGFQKTKRRQCSRPSVAFFVRTIRRGSSMPKSPAKASRALKMTRPASMDSLSRTPGAAPTFPKAMINCVDWLLPAWATMWQVVENRDVLFLFLFFSLIEHCIIVLPNLLLTVRSKSAYHSLFADHLSSNFEYKGRNI